MSMIRKVTTLSTTCKKYCKIHVPSRILFTCGVKTRVPGFYAHSMMFIHTHYALMCKILIFGLVALTTILINIYMITPFENGPYLPFTVCKFRSVSKKKWRKILLRKNDRAYYVSNRKTIKFKISIYTLNISK